MSNDIVDINEESLSSYKPVNAAPKQIGRQQGFQHLKTINTEVFITNHECFNLLLDHPWIREIKLVSNPYMYRTYGRANYKTNTVELSEKLMTKPSHLQREVFIRAICHFIADRFFSERGDGQGYQLLVNRYIKRHKGQSNSTGNVTMPVEEPTKELETTH